MNLKNDFQECWFIKNLRNSCICTMLISKEYYVLAKIPHSHFKNSDPNCFHEGDIIFWDAIQKKAILQKELPDSPEYIDLKNQLQKLNTEYNDIINSQYEALESKFKNNETTVNEKSKAVMRSMGID